MKGPIVHPDGDKGVGYVWPAEAAAQARWVKARLDAGLTPSEVHAALVRGEFTLQ